MILHMEDGEAFEKRPQDLNDGPATAAILPGGHQWPRRSCKWRASSTAQTSDRGRGPETLASDHLYFLWPQSVSLLTGDRMVKTLIIHF